MLALQQVWQLVEDLLAVAVDSPLVLHPGMLANRERGHTGVGRIILQINMQ